MSLMFNFYTRIIVISLLSINKRRVYADRIIGRTVPTNTKERNDQVSSLLLFLLDRMPIVMAEQAIHLPR